MLPLLITANILINVSKQESIIYHIFCTYIFLINLLISKCCRVSPLVNDQMVIVVFVDKVVRAVRVVKVVMAVMVVGVVMVVRVVRVVRVV